jgi:adenine-specific DNA-methyltransferase
LETKIVTANTLLPIPRDNRQLDLLTNPAVAEKEIELREANASHFAAKRFAEKRKRKERILGLRDELAELLKGELMLAPGDAARMSAWDPFDQNRHADFFDPEWMFGFSQGFDIVIGNPPYVRQEAIKDDKPRYKPHYACYNGTADLYVYFYERSIRLLNPLGVLSFITSNKWFRAKYGQDLRKFMTTHTVIRQIIDFGDEAVFDALAYPTIVVATKRAVAIMADRADNEVAVLNWDSKNEAHQVAHFPDVFEAEHFAVPQNELKPGGWQLEPPQRRLLLAELRKAGQPLVDYCQGRFYRGILTGLNEAFVIGREQRDMFIAQTPESASLIKPFLRGRDVKRWNVRFEDYYLIKIESSENVQHPWSEMSLVEAEELFAKTYPAIYVWMTSEDRRQQLIDRADQGHYFWELRSCAYWQEFEYPKIFVPAISDKVNYAPDLLGYLGNDKTSIIVSDDWRYILSILNSAVSLWWTRQLFASKQGGFFEFKPMYVTTIPIPSTTGQQKKCIERIVECIIKYISAPEYERLLNGLVYELFFPEKLHAKKICFFDACIAAGIADWAALGVAKDLSGNDQVAALAWAMHASSTADEIFHPRHPIYGMLFELETVDVVQIIEGKA